MDVEYAGMLNRGDTLKLKDLNAAFTNPKTISIAYFQASLLVEHIVNAYGEDGLRKVVRAVVKDPDGETPVHAFGVWCKKHYPSVAKISESSFEVPLLGRKSG